MVKQKKSSKIGKKAQSAIASMPAANPSIQIKESAF